MNRSDITYQKGMKKVYTERIYPERSRRSRSGFTMIELLVTVAIIGILATFAVIGYQSALVKARDVKRKTDIELIRSGIEIYKSDCLDYPSVLASPLKGDGTPATCAVTNTYISSIPKDPLDPARRYYYSRPTTTSYISCASLERVPVPLGDTTGCGSCGSGVTCNYKVTNP